MNKIGNYYTYWVHDWEVSTALRRIGYNGAVLMEPFLTSGGKVGRDIRVYRELSSGLDLDEEARKARMFICGVLK